MQPWEYQSALHNKKSLARVLDHFSGFSIVARLPVRIIESVMHGAKIE